MLHLIQRFLSSEGSTVGSSSSSSSSPVSQTAREIELENLLKQLSIKLATASSLCELPQQLSVDSSVQLTVESLSSDLFNLTGRLTNIQKLLFLPSTEVQETAAPSASLKVYNSESLQTKLSKFLTQLTGLNEKIAEEQKAIVQDFAPIAAASVPSDSTASSSEEPVQVLSGAVVVEGKINRLIEEQNGLIVRIQKVATALQTEMVAASEKIKENSLVTLTPEECEKISKLFSGVNMEFVLELHRNKTMPIITALEQRRSELVDLMGQVEKWKGESLKPVQDAFNASVQAYILAYTYQGTVPSGLAWYMSKPNAELAKTEFTKVATL